MKLKIVTTKAICDKLWAHGASSNQPVIPLEEDDVIIELDEEVVQKILDVYDCGTFDEALEQLASSETIS